jgi:hypothetical protein
MRVIIRPGYNRLACLGATQLRSIDVRCYEARVPPLRDTDIRTAAKALLLARAEYCPDTRIVEELGLSHGAARIDIAVINGHIRGIEIKAEADTLSRLPRQVSAYGRVVDLATLIAAERHIDAAASLLPGWWGIVEARKTRKGTVAFRRRRYERVNRGLDPMTLARLLWHAEVAQLLRQLGADESLLRSPRAILYAELVAALPITRLRRAVRETLKTRENWRDRARPSSYGGSFQPIAMW